MCCACNGGESSTCWDTDYDLRDANSESCADYTAGNYADNLAAKCGPNDGSSGFSAMANCCECGGGDK